ncbi:MAG: hypothetical protein WEE20_00980 [Bacteroidota bacterium]
MKLRQSTPFISKSKYLNGLQCHKLLWFHYNAKDPRLRRKNDFGGQAAPLLKGEGTNSFPF